MLQHVVAMTAYLFDLLLHRNSLSISSKFLKIKQSNTHTKSLLTVCKDVLGYALFLSILNKVKAWIRPGTNALLLKTCFIKGESAPKVWQGTLKLKLC